MKVDMGVQLKEMGSKDFVNGEVSVKRECEECSKCLELEDQITKVNKKCRLLELDIEKKKNVIEWLEGKLGFMELKRLKIEDEVRVLKQMNEDLEKSIQNGERVFSKEDKGMMNGVVDLTEVNDEEDRVKQLMIENNVLECEKKKAECEVEVWKAKFKELEMQVMELGKKILVLEMDSAKMSGEGGQIHVRASLVQTENENKASEDKEATGTPFINTPSKQYTSAEEVKGSHQCDFKLMRGSRVRKRLGFAEEGSPGVKFSPPTPCGGPPFCPIDIDVSDGGDNLNIPHLHLSDLDIERSKKICSSTDTGSGNALYKNELTSKDRCTRVLEHPSDEEDITCNNGTTPYLSSPKRRRVSMIFISESESDNDDIIPICRLRSKYLQSHNSDSNLNSNSGCDTDSRDKLKKPTPRRRLTRLRNCEERRVSGKCTNKSTESKNTFGIPTYESVDEDEREEDDSSSEGESLGGFIVNSSSDCDDISNHDGPLSADDSSGKSENSSDSSVDYNEIISGLSRDSKHKMKWNFEAGMLAVFGKHPEVCMKAVCALYRQQTSEEKSCKATITLNGRGFSQCDAHRGSALAEFLTDGDPQGDLKKSVKELLKFNPEGVELCRDLAIRYSRQLFAIYQNKEDPFFRPP